MWKTVKLGEVCTIKTGKKDVNEGNRVGRFPFFTCAKEHTYSDVYSFDCEAILIAGNGAVGQTTYFKGKFEAYQRTYVLSDFQLIHPKLLLFILQGTLMQHLSSKVLGNTIPYIKKGMLENFEITLPPLAEQQRIVEKLDRAFAEIDGVIENSKQAQLRKTELFSLTIEKKLSALPKKCLKKFGDVCSFVRGPFGGALKKSNFVEQGYAVYEQQHPINDCFDSFRYFISQHKFDEMKRFKVSPGDLLMSCSGVTLGRVAIVPPVAPNGIINQALLKITPSSSLKGEYLKLLMRSQYFQKILWKVSGWAAQPNVPPISVIKEFDIPVPELDIQVDFIDLMKKISLLDASNIYLKKVQAFVSLKSAILKQALQPPQQ